MRRTPVLSTWSAIVGRTTLAIAAACLRVRYRGADSDGRGARRTTDLINARANDMVFG